MGKKKKKVNKKKFISRIFTLILILVVLIFGISKLFKPKKEEIAKLTLIVDNVNITDNLATEIYIDTAQKLYMSITDIKNVFDEGIYFEEESGRVITTSGTKVGAIDVNTNTFELNSATLLLSSPVIKYDENYFLPISDITNVYNIEVRANDKVAVVSSLYKEFTTIKTTKKVSLKEKTGTFAKTIEKLPQDEEVIYLGNAEKEGWIKVLTYNGNEGYLKEKKTKDKQQIRTNMSENFNQNTPDLSKSIEISKKTIKNDAIKNFSARKTVIDKIISDCISKDKYTVNLNLKDVEAENSNLERLVIELMPRLKEIGGSTAITNNSILSNEFLSKYGIN